MESIENLLKNNQIHKRSTITSLNYRLQPIINEDDERLKQEDTKIQNFLALHSKVQIKTKKDVMENYYNDLMSRKNQYYLQKYNQQKLKSSKYKISKKFNQENSEFIHDELKRLDNTEQKVRAMSVEKRMKLQIHKMNQSREKNKSPSISPKKSKESQNNRPGKFINFQISSRSDNQNSLPKLGQFKKGGIQLQRQKRATSEPPPFYLMPMGKMNQSNESIAFLNNSISTIEGGQTIMNTQYSIQDTHITNVSNLKESYYQNNLIRVQQENEEFNDKMQAESGKKIKLSQNLNSHQLKKEAPIKLNKKWAIFDTYKQQREDERTQIMLNNKLFGKLESGWKVRQHLSENDKFLVRSNNRQYISRDKQCENLVENLKKKSQIITDLGYNSDLKKISNISQQSLRVRAIRSVPNLKKMQRDLQKTAIINRINDSTQNSIINSSIQEKFFMNSTNSNLIYEIDPSESIVLARQMNLSQERPKFFKRANTSYTNRLKTSQKNLPRKIEELKEQFKDCLITKQLPDKSSYKLRRNLMENYSKQYSQQNSSTDIDLFTIYVEDQLK